MKLEAGEKQHFERHESGNSVTICPKKCNFVQFLTLNFQIFEIFPPKNANLDNFILKKCNFGQLSPSDCEKYGVILVFFKPSLMEEAKPPTA